MAIRPVTGLLWQNYTSGSGRVYGRGFRHARGIRFNRYVMANSLVKFEVGECFSSYPDLEAKVKAYERSNSVQLTHRDLNLLIKRVPQRVAGAKADLKYYNIHYTCIFGGKKYKNMGSGARMNQRLVFIACATTV